MNTLLSVLRRCAGQAATIHAQRPIRTDELSSGNKHRNIVKVSVHNVRVVERDKTKAVIEARANGTSPATNQGLKGKVWVEYPFVKRSLVTDKLMIQVIPMKNGTKSTFMEDGEEISREEYENATVPSSRKRYGNQPPTFDLTLDSITSIRMGGHVYEVVGDDIVEAEG